MNADSKQKWYERVTYAKLLAEHRVESLKEKFEAGEIPQEELKLKYTHLYKHQATILVTTSLFFHTGQVKTHKGVPDLLMSSQLYWDAKALQYWILTREDMNAERNPFNNMNKQKQAKANARAFKSWRNKFLKFEEYVEELEGV